MAFAKFQGNRQRSTSNRHHSKHTVADGQCCNIKSTFDQLSWCARIRSTNLSAVYEVAECMQCLNEQC